MFMGEYNHTIDAKGRLIMPSKFRESLGESFTVTKGLDGCLFVFDPEEWVKFQDSLKELPYNVAEARKITRFFMAGASVCEVDKQGRIPVAPSLRQHAHLEKDVVLAGVGSRIEIWDKERWDAANSYDNVEEIAENMEGLGLKL